MSTRHPSCSFLHFIIASRSARVPQERERDGVQLHTKSHAECASLYRMHAALPIPHHMLTPRLVPGGYFGQMVDGHLAGSETFAATYRYHFPLIFDRKVS